MIITNEQIAEYGLALFFALVIALLVWRLRQHVSAQRQETEKLRTRELAVMEEQIRLTMGGAICWVLLFVSVAVSIGAYSRAVNILQQIEAGVSLMAGILLFGLGAALGRRRVYRIYRSEQRTDQ